MFNKKDILFEDNHIMVVNKIIGQAVQADNSDDISLEDEIKNFIKVRDEKPGNVFLGVVHRIDKPVSGAVVFAKSAKALRRLNEMVKERNITKTYWAIVSKQPPVEVQELTHYILRDSKKNRSFAYDREKRGSKVATLSYELLCVSQNFYLLDVNLITGRHHQIRAQLSKVGMPIKGDLKYGSPRSNKGGGICLHARSIEFIHPVTKENLKVTAPVPQEDNLWRYFEGCLK
ncbi:MAG: RluA family pseudouridine synthase [Bacteroidetes bacterium]|nr:RluA family pseudouridine synthase [Bacteroidota bacterium]